MQLTSILLADAVQAIGGKLYMLGAAWNVLNVAQFPTTHLIGLGLVIDLGWNETNERHRMQIHVEDADGNQFAEPRVDAELEAGRPPGLAPGSDIRVALALNVPVELTKPGQYSFVLTRGDEELGRARFQAVPKG